MKASQRLGRWGLVLLLGGAAGGFGLMPSAHADDTETVSIDAGSSGAATCVNSFVSRGRAVVAGPSYEIPFRSVGGGPYVENEVNSRPSTLSFASDAYEGWIGDIVLGTSGVYPQNVTSAVAHYPPAPNGGSSADIKFGPFARTQATAQPWVSMAKAQANGQDESSGGVFGPSTAVTNSSFDGKLLKGVDEIVGYDLHLGPVLVKQMHSTLKYETDGTQAGTKATWALEFSGVGGDNSKVYTITPEGFAPQGGTAQPGAAGMKQFNDGSKAFADALEKAGIARPEMKVAPATVEVRGPGELYVQVAALELRNAIVGAHNTTGHAQGWLFGYNERYLKLELGSCDADISQDKPADENQPTKMQQYGPFQFPDPGAGGSKPPKSRPAPVAAVPHVLTSVVKRPAPVPVPVASTEPTIGVRPTNTSWAHGVF
jgi:hypothetical protein